MRRQDIILYIDAKSCTILAIKNKQLILQRKYDLTKAETIKEAIAAIINGKGAVFCYLDSADVVLDSVIIPFASESAMNKMAHNTAMSGGILGLAMGEDRYAAYKKQKRSRPYQTLSVSKIFASEGIKNLINAISASVRAIKLINFLPLNLITAKLGTNNTNVINVILRIKSTHIAISAFCQNKLLVSREELIKSHEDADMHAAIMKTIDDTIYYVDITLANLEAVFEVIIITNEEKRMVSEQMKAKYTMRVIDISALEALCLANKPNVVGEENISYSLIALCYFNRYDHKNLTNAIIQKKTGIDRTLNYTYLLCLSALAVAIIYSLGNLGITYYEYNGAKSNFNLSQTKLSNNSEYFASQNLSDSDKNKLSLIFALNSIDKNHATYLEGVTSLQKAMAKANQDIQISKYSWQCKILCQDKNFAKTELIAEGNIYSDNSYFEDAKQNIANLQKTLQQLLPNKNVTVKSTMPMDNNDISKDYREVAITIELSSK